MTSRAPSDIVGIALLPHQGTDRATTGRDGGQDTHGASRKAPYQVTSARPAGALPSPAEHGRQINAKATTPIEGKSQAALIEAGTTLILD